MNGTDDVVVMQDVARSYVNPRGVKTEALKGLSLRVPRGAVYGLLGRNGAGKSTALRVMLGLLRPDRGSSSILGEDSRALSPDVRRRIGYLSEEPFPYDALPFAPLLRFLSAFFPQWDGAYVEALADRMQIPRDRTLRDMSVGERRRTELFLALAPRPEVLILDDPWLGVDAVARRDVLTAVLNSAADEGLTILFTSHVLTDVERVADRVGILVDGRLREEGELDALKARVKRLSLELPAGVDPSSIAIDGEVSRRVEGRLLTATTTRFSPALEAALRARGAEVAVEDLNLEAAFCEITGYAPGGGVA